MGSQGEWPPNQDLLDWLAVEFVDSGWDVKHMVRLMVTSSAYRQSSLPRPELDAIDPDNRLVARQSRFRLDAEQIRDNALAVSGLLVTKIGGDVVAAVSAGEGTTRRSNFPEREYQPSTDERPIPPRRVRPLAAAVLAPVAPGVRCTHARGMHGPTAISNTPTAALVLLNDPSFVEAARALAARVLDETPRATTERIALGLATGAGPRRRRANEVESLRELLEKHRAHFATNRASGRSARRRSACRREHRSCDAGRTRRLDVRQPRAC